MNRGSKIRVKAFSAKLLSAFENEKITMHAEDISRGNEHVSLNSVNVTWKLQYSLQQLKSSFGGTFGTRGKVKMLQKLGKFLFRVNFNGFLLGLDKLALFKLCLPGTYVVHIVLTCLY